MKLAIERSALLRSLGHVQSVVERRNTIPILSNILIEAKGGRLSLTATDLDIEVVETIPADVTVDGVELAIDVADTNVVEIDHGDFTDGGAGKGLHCPTADAADTDDADTRTAKFLQAMRSDEAADAAEALVKIRHGRKETQEASKGKRIF